MIRMLGLVPQAALGQGYKFPTSEDKTKIEKVDLQEIDQIAKDVTSLVLGEKIDTVAFKELRENLLEKVKDFNIGDVKEVLEENIQSALRQSFVVSSEKK